MYIPSKIFQASQQSVKLLSSPHHHDQEVKVSPFLPWLGWLSTASFSSEARGSF